MKGPAFEFDQVAVVAARIERRAKAIDCGVKLLRSVILSEAVVQFATSIQEICIALMGSCVVWVNFNRPQEFLLCSVPVQITSQRYRCHLQVRLGQAIVQFQRLSSISFRFIRIPAISEI
jgi:hypothetical protein